MKLPGRTVACTIADAGYLPRAVVAAESIRAVHPDLEIVALLVGLARVPPAGELPFRALGLADLPHPPSPAMTFRYDAMALASALKPHLLEAVDAGLGPSRALYFDADTLALGRLDPFLAPLDRHAMTVNPILGAPPVTPVVSPEGLLRRTGLLSAGCFGIRFEPSSRRFLAFWRRQLERACTFDPWLGLVHDQSWFDFAPSFVDEVAFVRETAAHLGYWNVGEAALERRPQGWFHGGRPVGLLHATGFDPSRPERISRHLAAEHEPFAEPLGPLLQDYGRRVRAAAGRLGAVAPDPGLARFRGTDLSIPLACRRLVAAVDPLGERWPDPYEPVGASSCLSWLTEPLAFPSGTLVRAALALWESRTDLIDAFPDPCGRDLPGFVAWLLDHGGAADAGFDSRLLGAVGVGPPPAEIAPAAPEEARRAAPERRDPRAALWMALARMPEAPTAALLGEPVGRVETGASALPRAALLLHRFRPDLQRRFPDPAGFDRARFLAWWRAGAR